MKRPQSPRRFEGALALARHRILATLAPAAVGCFVGFHLGQRFGDPELGPRIGLPGLYASLGAVAAVLAVRVLGLFAEIIRDLRGRS